MPPLLGFLSWAYTLAITHAHEETHDWFYTNFVLLSCNTDYLEPRRFATLDFWRGGQNEMLENNPFLHCRAIGYEPFFSLRDPNRLISDLRLAIDEDFYPMVFLDETLLEFSTTHGTNRFYPHHVLLYGYDPEQETFDALGFGRHCQGDIFGKFGPQRVSAAEIIAAVDSMRIGLKEGRIYEQLTFFLKLKKLAPDPFPPSYAFDLDLLRRTIIDYLEGQSYCGRSNRNMENTLIGLKVYDELDRYFHLVEQRRMDADREDVRHLHILEDHKRIMVERVRYLARKNIVAADDAERLALAWQGEAEKLFIAKLRALKNSASTNPSYCNAMRELLRGQRNADEILMTALLKLL